jgi:hypothetical protein
MINDQTTGLLNHCFNEVPHSARNAIRHWQHRFRITDVWRRHVCSVRVAADGVVPADVGQCLNHLAPVLINAASAPQNQFKLCSRNLDAEADRALRVPDGLSDAKTHGDSGAHL